MAKTLEAIRGVPMRRIVLREKEGRSWKETLECGHVIYKELADHNTKFRRCYTCGHESQSTGKGSGG